MMKVQPVQRPQLIVRNPQKGQPWKRKGGVQV